MPQRKDINKLTEGEVNDYIHALDILRNRSAADPDDIEGYAYQAALHNDTSVGPCEHGNDLFLPWHRAHLYYFERLLQQTDPPRTSGVTIPYWDWIHQDPVQKFPERFSLPGLFMEGRSTTQYPLPPDTLKIVTGEKDWNTFGGWPKRNPNGDYGRLELGPHNDMHGSYIGGPMGDPSSAAEDAIYFSFHCFIDLLYAEWQKRNGFPPATSPASTLRGFTEQPLNKVQDFFRCSDLGYEYAYTAELALAFAPTTPISNFRNLVEKSSLPSLFEGKLSDQLSKKSNAQFAMPAVPLANESVVVLIRDLAIPHTGSYTLFVYLHPRHVPFDKNDPDFHKIYYVGYASLWLSHSEHHPDHHENPGHHHTMHEPIHPTSAKLRFDITEKYIRFNRLHDDLVITIAFQPSPGIEERPQAVKDLIKEIKVKDVILETSIH